MLEAMLDLNETLPCDIPDSLDDLEYDGVWEYFRGQVELAARIFNLDKDDVLMMYVAARYFRGEG